MQDYDCTLYTLGHFANCSSRQVANRTDYMEGPPLSEGAVTDMIQRLRFALVEPEVCANLTDAIDYMMNRAMSSEFAFGCIPSTGGVGHMVCAFRTNCGIVLRDYQNNGASYNPPAGTIYIWQIFRS